MEHTRNGEIVKWHVKEMWIHASMFESPCNCICDVFNISVKIMVQLGAQVSSFGWCECRQVIKHISYLVADEQCLAGHQRKEHSYLGFITGVTLCLTGIFFHASIVIVGCILPCILIMHKYFCCEGTCQVWGMNLILTWLICGHCDDRGKNTRCYSNSEAVFEVYIQDCM